MIISNENMEKSGRNRIKYMKELQRTPLVLLYIKNKSCKS